MKITQCDLLIDSRLDLVTICKTALFAFVMFELGLLQKPISGLSAMTGMAVVELCNEVACFTEALYLLSGVGMQQIHVAFCLLAHVGAHRHMQSVALFGRIQVKLVPSQILSASC